jgi:F-type H+-transporting ATPase subunit delta
MIGRVARPYAKACFNVAGSPDVAQRVLGELRSLAATLAEHPSLERAASNPGVPLETKLAVVEQVAGKLGSGPITRRLAAVLTRNHRLGRVGEIADGLETLVRRSLGTVKAEVKSATPLSADQLASLQSGLAKAVGSPVDIETSTDPSLMAGFVATVGSKVFDASLKRRLQRLSARLAQA